MQKNGFRISRALMVAALLFCVQVHANSTGTVYVTTGSIQDAINQASPGMSVQLNAGTYLLSEELVIEKEVELIGDVNDPSSVIIDGGGITRCIRVDDVACTISGLTIQNGYTYNTGAGISSAGSLPVISNCVITNNRAGSGGGIYGGTVMNSTIVDNQAGSGGGAEQSILVRCRVLGNAAEYSGGGLSYGSATNCYFLKNRTTGIGGYEQIIAGGALYEADAFGCVISANETRGLGGGACWSDLYNCTLTDNTAFQGGGVYNADLYNCIVWNNLMTGPKESASGGEGDEVAFISADSDGHLPGNDIYGGRESYYSCSPDLDHGPNNNITNDPCLVSYSHIATNSPCVRAGTTNFSDNLFSTTDIDGENWDFYMPSMGCDENHGTNTLMGDIALTIDGPPLIVTGHEADYFFYADGIATLVVATIGNQHVVTNPVGAVEITWSAPGTNEMILTACNETFPDGTSITQQVIVASALDSAVHVSTTGDDRNDGSSWTLAKRTIQAGIDVQNFFGGRVLVADGSYLAGTYSPDIFPIKLNAPVVLKGTNTVPAAILDAGGSNTCVEIVHNNAVLQSLVVRNGWTDESGGAGIDCRMYPGAVVRDCMVRENTGTGIYGGTVINSQILMNDGSALESAYGIGSAIAYNDGGHAVELCMLYNCTIVQNRSIGVFASSLFNTIAYFNNSQSTQSGGNDISYCDYLEYVCSPDVEHGNNGCITNKPWMASISHLSGATSCNGAGNAVYALETDIDHEAWLSPPSIGCDENYGHGTVTGEIDLMISGISTCAEGSAVDYDFLVVGPATQPAVVDFGDSSSVTNPAGGVQKTWHIPGVFELVLTSWNDTYPDGFSITQQISVVSLDASTIYVSGDDGDDANNGTSWTLAKQTVQSGVDTQDLYGGRVFVSNGTYEVDAAVSIQSPIKLVGFGGYDETIIAATGSGRGIEIGHSRAVIADLCITNGSGTYGGGIRCTTTTPIITNCLITGCSASHTGGGGYYGTYIDCIIDDNSGERGGGLAYAVAKRCLITGNTATGSYSSEGGGTYYGESHACLFRGNHAKYGGGAYRGNHYNATIVSNSCTTSGGGSNYANLYNSIVHGNLRYSSPNNIYRGNAFHTCSPDVSHAVDGCITNDPMFIDPLADNYRLAAGSPCINAGSTDYTVIAVDLDGNPRKIGSVDLGAYQYDETAPDSDGDGVSDPDEQIAGTGKNDPDDFFCITGISSTATGTEISWNPVAGRIYSVYWTDNLVAGPFIELINGIETGSYKDVVYGSSSNGFYLIKVELAP